MLMAWGRGNQVMGGGSSDWDCIGKILWSPWLIVEDLGMPTKTQEATSPGLLPPCPSDTVYETSAPT